jgi:phosphoglycerate kinase
MKSITTATDLKGKRALLRTTFNVPLEGETILDTTRLDEALQTIQFLRNAGARTLLLSHHSDGETATLRPAFDYLKERVPLRFVEDFRSVEAKELLEGMADGDIIMLENVRRYPEEEQNDRRFAEELSALADVFVNDDFTTAHRAHASVVGVPALLPSYAGLVFEREHSFLSQALDAPTPSLAIIGGAKPETKLPLIATLTDTMTDVFVGGVSANVVWQSRGLSIGKSATVVDGIPEVAAVNAAKNAHLPCDVRVEDPNGDIVVVAPDDVPSGAAIVDAGPQTLQELRDLIDGAAFILWNGPLGEYEKGYTESTHALARLLAKSGKRVIIGGGDTVGAVKRLGLGDAYTFVSTAGGAMIDFLAHGTLPGIEALNKAS